MNRSATNGSAVAALDRFADVVNSLGEARWTLPAREAARDHVMNKGLPTPRDEAWRFANIRSLDPNAFTTPTAVQLDRGRVDELAPRELHAHQLVFVDGRFQPELSASAAVLAPAIVGSLRQAWQDHRELVEPYFDRILNYHDNAYAALNTSLVEDGLFVYVPRGVVLDRPLHAMFIGGASGETMSLPRILVVMEESSQATLLEDYVGWGEHRYFTNAVTEVQLRANANLRHVRWSHESEGAFHLGSLACRQDRDSHYAAHSFAVRGGLTRNDAVAELAGTGAECQLSGLVVAGENQLVDNHTEIRHLVSHTNSQQHYRYILDGRARGVFAGMVHVAPDAQKIDAQQNNENLLLSDGATMNTIPQLEIYADDVKCSHGATLGQLDSAQLFYMRSRGIDEKTARNLLTYAFASEIMEAVPVLAARAAIASMVFDQLPLDALETDLVREGVGHA